MQEALHEGVRTAIRDPEFLKEVERVSLLRRATAISASDSRNARLPIRLRQRGRIEFAEVPVAEPTIEHAVPEREEATIPARIADVCERCEDPMRTLPLRIGVLPCALPSARQMTGEKGTDPRRPSNGRLERLDFPGRWILSDDMDADLPTDGRFARVE